MEHLLKYNRKWCTKITSKGLIISCLILYFYIHNILKLFQILIINTLSLLLFSSKACPTLQGHSLQHVRLLCPHDLTEFAQTHVHCVEGAIQQFHVSPPSPPAPNLSHHQGLYHWVSSSHQVAKVLDFQLQQQSFQWTPRTDLL